MFWNTPAASARTLRFTEKLMDEEVDINDVSVLSFTSPVPRPRSVLSSLGLPADEDSLDDGGRDARPDESIMPDPPDEEELAEEGNQEEVDDGNEEQTVILKKYPLSSPPKHTPPESNPPADTPLHAHPEPQTPAAVPPESTRKPKVRMNSEIERIVVTIVIGSSGNM
jgi:hypothetical protein